MKRIYAITLAALGTTMALSAQSKFDPSAALLVQSAQTQKAIAAKSRAGVEIKALANDVDVTSKRLVLVSLKDGLSADKLAQMGYDVENTESSIIFARLTPEEMSELAAMDGVKSISLGSPLEPLLNTARKATGVDELHSGSAATGNHTYTGKGVLVGMMDTGLDPNHSNFTIDGEPRIERLWIITGRDGSVQTLDTPTKIKNYTTDNADATHGTHVLGIMAGGYNGSSGEGKVATISRTGKVSVTSNTNIPYYGVAKDANLAVCIGTLDNNNSLLAAERLYNYAKETNQPVVMNFSLGNNRGPHDGTDNHSQKLAQYGKDMLICISAGNEGNYNVALEKKFTASDNVLKSCLSRTSAATGSIDVWGDNASALKLTFAAVDPSNGDIKYSYKLERNTQGVLVNVGGTAYSQYTDVTVNKEIDNYFGPKAIISISSNLNPDNNRYNISLTATLPGLSSSTVVPAVFIEGTAGNGVNAFCNGVPMIQFFSNGLAGYVDGSNSNSINGMACGDNILCVGAYNNTDKIPTIEMGIQSSTGTTGDISSFSSFGKSFAGKLLPDVVGPGQGMISSYSKYYMEKHNTSSDYTTRVAEVVTDTKGTKDYWAEMSGTSMSSPFVAGVLAVWLEADPTLTMDRVKEIIKKTADNDNFTAQNPERWGMGKINALAGLKEILSTGAVNTVEADDATDKMIIEPLGGKRYSVFVGGTDNFTVNLYNLQGALMATVAANGNTAEVDASAFADGIYLMEVQGRNIHTSRKLMVK